MAGVIFGNESMFSSMTGTPMSTAFSKARSALNDRALSRLNDVGRAFREKTREFKSNSRFSDIEFMIDRTRRLRDKLFLEDNVRELTSLELMVEAKPRMRRWLLADPYMRKLYRERKLSGWDKSVILPDDIQLYPDEETNADYRYVMDGVLNDTEFVEYIDMEVEALEEEEQLTQMDKFDIRLSWERARAYIMHDKKDPTSLWGGTLDGSREEDISSSLFHERGAMQYTDLKEKEPIRPYPSLDGWEFGIEAKLESILLSYFTANKDQTLIFNNRVSSFIYTLSENWQKPYDCAVSVEGELNNLMSAYFHKSSVQVSSVDDEDNPSRFNLNIEITVGDNITGIYNTRQVTFIEDGKLMKFLQYNNEGQLIHERNYTGINT